MTSSSSSSVGRYIRESELGEGTYGVVFKARDRLTGGIVAIKRMHVSTEDEGVPATTIREVCLLKELQHPNIVRLFDVTYQPPKLTLVFECCDFDLKKYMDSKRPKVIRGTPVPADQKSDPYLKENKSSSKSNTNYTGSSGLDIEKEVKCMLKQLLLGLNYMHQRHVVHRDLKPQNILINSNLQLKIADFGLARVEGIPVKKYTHEAVTLWYRPPDVILGSTNYGFVVDMWSVGCIFVEMVIGRPIFNGHNEAEQLHKIYSVLGSPTAANFPNLKNYPNYKSVYQSSKNINLEECHYPSTLDNLVETTDLKNINHDGIDLINRMLAYDPNERITASEALEHPFISEYKVKCFSGRTSDDGLEALSQLYTPSCAKTESKDT